MSEWLPTRGWGPLNALIYLTPPFSVPSHQVLDMEELTIWEQHTATISKVGPPSPCMGLVAWFPLAQWRGQPLFG